MKKLMMVAMVAAAVVATADDWGFTYQAELRDEKGNVLSGTSHSVEIRLWDAPTGGNKCLWGRTYNIETDTNGLFNVAVSAESGSVVTEWTGVAEPTLADVFAKHAAGGVYVGLTVVGSAGEIVPRQRIYAVPFAGTANAARSLIGDTVTVAGSLTLDNNTSFSKAGVRLASTSASTMGTVTASKVTVSGTALSSAGIETTNIKFSGTLKHGDKEVVPVPVGGIIMWTMKTPPEGGSWSDSVWAVCDGQVKNGVTTPNLRSRFIVGVDTDDADYVDVGKRGGEKTHRLGSAELPAHCHDLGNGSSWYNVKGSTHDIWTSDKVSFSTPWATGDGVESGKYAGGMTGYAGAGAAHENRPPYYALYFIMRTK